MKIYVSGKITGLPIEEAKQRFANSQALLESIGFEVVNPLEFGLCDEKASWESHMVKDIELLFGCDAIYMMDNWTGSTGCGLCAQVCPFGAIEISNQPAGKRKLFIFLYDFKFIILFF